MKHIYVTITLVTISLLSDGQSLTWCPPGAQWHYSINYFAQTGYVDLKYVSDTVVDGIICKKILACSESIDQQIGTHYPYNCSLAYFTYENNGVIYSHGFTGWDTLYNLHAVPGDTWDMYPGNTNDIMQVLDTGHQVIQNMNLRWLTVTYPNSVQSFIVDTIVERMGCINYNYPYTPSVTSTDPAIYDFCNYSDDQFPDWKTTDADCTYLPTGIHEQNSEIHLSVFPIPANQEITVATLQIGILTITNFLNGTLLELPIKNSPVNISMENMAAGIYLLTFQTSNGIQIKKILVHH